MSIKEKVEYHGKECCGYVDIIVMLNSMNDDWKLPIAYYLINSLSADDAACNLSTFKKLGASLDIDNLKSFFTHPSTGKNVYIILDPYHILKLIRNCLAFKDILMDKDNNIINWLYFIKLVQLQEKKDFHLGTKIRKRHNVGARKNESCPCCPNIKFK
ncbi:hypothetical protein ACFW04_002513 [Cataglyphis niger]